MYILYYIILYYIQTYIQALRKPLLIIFMMLLYLCLCVYVFMCLCRVFNDEDHALAAYGPIKSLPNYDWIREHSKPAAFTY